MSNPRSSQPLILRFRLFTTIALVTILSLATIGCKKNTTANGAATPSEQSTPSVTLPDSVEKGSKTEKPDAEKASAEISESSEAKLNQEKNSNSNKTKSGRSESQIANGIYSLGGNDQSLAVEGDRYRYFDSEITQEWRPIAELTYVQSGVVYDGNNYWCLNNMMGEPSVCTENGWRSYEDALVEEPTDRATDSTRSADSDIDALGLRENMPYQEARSLILAQGWEPNQAGDAPNLNSSTIRELYDFGYPEIKDCAGTGLGQCRFEFRNGAGQVLVVSAIQEGENTNRLVWQWWLEE
jgi:hypothetical protein